MKKWLYNNNFIYTAFSLSIASSIFATEASIIKDESEKLCSQILSSATNITATPLMERHEDDACVVFSFDGGGSRGILSAHIAHAIETKLGRPIADLADIVVGTSTGSIIASLLSTKRKNTNAALHTAEEVCGIYKKELGRIFSRSWLHTIRSLWGYWGPKYTGSELRDILYRAFREHDHGYDYLLTDRVVKQEKTKAGETRECHVQLLTTAYQISDSHHYGSKGKNAFIFDSEKARNCSSHNFHTSTMLSGTTAQPVFFPAAKVKSLGGHEVELFDPGALVNPSLIGLHAARKFVKKRMYPNATCNDNDYAQIDKKIVIISVGSGEVEPQFDFYQAVYGGALHMIIPEIHILLGAQKASTDWIIRKLCPNVTYLRLQIPLSSDIDGGDQVDPQTLMALKGKADEIIAGSAFQSTIDKLKSIKKIA